jgi:hypothetical protein
MSTRRYLVVPSSLDRWAVQLGRTHIESFDRMEVAVAFAQRCADAADGDSNVLMQTPAGRLQPAWVHSTDRRRWTGLRHRNMLRVRSIFDRIYRIL